MSEARLVFREDCTNEVFLTCHLRLFRLFTSVDGKSDVCGRIHSVWEMKSDEIVSLEHDRFFPIHMESFTSLLGFVVCYLC